MSSPNNHANNDDIVSITNDTLSLDDMEDLSNDIFSTHLEAPALGSMSFEEQINYAKVESLRVVKHSDGTEETVEESIEMGTNEEEESKEQIIRSSNRTTYYSKRVVPPENTNTTRGLYNRYLEDEVERLRKLIRDVYQAADCLHEVDPTLYQSIFGHLNLNNSHDVYSNYHYDDDIEDVEES
jgi:hypothetical protein